MHSERQRSRRCARRCHHSFLRLPVFGSVDGNGPDIGVRRWRHGGGRLPYIRSPKEGDMKPRKSPGKLVTILIAAAAAATLLAESVHAGPYQFVNLGTIGGTQSGGNSINARGWASGFGTLIGDATQHATLWVNGATVDLGTLGGDNSGVEWLVHNDKGQIAGISETGT